LRVLLEEASKAVDGSWAAAAHGGLIRKGEAQVRDILPDVCYDLRYNGGRLDVQAQGYDGRKFDGGRAAPGGALPPQGPEGGRPVPDRVAGRLQDHPLRRRVLAADGSR